MTVDPGSLCQVEIPVSDIERSLEFYQKVLGWMEAPCDIHNYKILQVPAGNPFGISLIGSVRYEKAPQGMTLYFKSDDPDQVAAAAEAFLKREMPKGRNLPGYGRVRIIEDPDGHRIGLYTVR